MEKRVLLTATVQSHICQFHKPLIRILKEYGFKVDVAARNNLSEKNGQELENVDDVFDIPFTRNPISINNLKCYFALRKIIKEKEYSIVSCNTPAAGVVTRLAARNSENQMVYYTAHGFHFYKGASVKNWLLYYPIEKIMARRCNTIITINEEDYKFASSHLRTNTVRIHGVGADSSRFRLKDEQLSNEYKKRFDLLDKKVVICVGELNANKNQKVLIEAMKEIVYDNPNTVLLLAGNGPLDASLHNLVKELRLERHVRFLGYVTNVQDYVQAADVLVSCSFREGLPMNIVEAMLSGIPIVAARNRGNSELIQDNYTGWSFDPSNEDDCYRAVIAALTDDTNRKVYVENALKLAQLFSVENVSKELKQVYIGEKK